MRGATVVCVWVKYDEVAWVASVPSAYILCSTRLNCFLGMGQPTLGVPVGMSDQELVRVLVFVFVLVKWLCLFFGDSFQAFCVRACVFIFVG